jgi:hypothetical protein
MHMRKCEKFACDDRDRAPYLLCLYKLSPLPLINPTPSLSLTHTHGDRVKILLVTEIGYPTSCAYINVQFLSPLSTHLSLFLSLSLSHTMRCSLQWRRRARRMRARKKRLRLPLGENTEATETSIQRKLRQLQRMIPNCCHEMDLETLYPRIAVYILLLEVKVDVLKNLSILYGV